MKGILIVSFGTTVDETRRKNIEALAHEVQRRTPNTVVHTAFTSGMVLKKLAQRGIHIFSVPQAFDEFYKEGIHTVCVLPTHLLHGIEYEKLEGFLLAHNSQNPEKSLTFHLAPPLLDHWEMQQKILHILAHRHPLPHHTALLLVGHGTHHRSNQLYPALDYMAKAEGFPHIFVMTIEGYPTLDTVLGLLKQDDFTHVHLLPFMFVAGDHAQNDMISEEPTSIKSLLETKGFHVTYTLEGLGECEEIQALYCNPLKEWF